MLHCVSNLKNNNNQRFGILQNFEAPEMQYHRKKTYNMFYKQFKKYWN